MPVVANAVNQWLEHADQRLLTSWYRASSIRVDRLRDALRERRAAFVDPNRSRAESLPPLVAIDRTAHELMHDAAEAARVRSRAVGLVGAMSLPTEVVWATVAALRLGQRLCVVYGFDPNTDRGRMALCQALAAAYEVELPTTGPAGFKLSELTALLRNPAPPPSISARLTQAMATQTALWAASRVQRWLPLLGAAGQGQAAHQRTLDAGERMTAVLRRLSEAPGSSRARFEDALEV